jgi:hypothetical protein
VEDLEDEVAEFKHTFWKLKSELEVIEDLIKGKKNAIDEHKELSKNTQNNKKLFVTIENSTL